MNLIAAGFVDTPLSASILGDQLDARREELRDTLPIRRVVGPADIAALAVHLMANTRGHRCDVRHRRRAAARMSDSEIRARIQQHWDASERGDVEVEHEVYADDAILDYPQSGERFRGRAKIQAQRGGHPAERHFTVRRIVGSGDLCVSECMITYDGVPPRSARRADVSQYDRAR